MALALTISIPRSRPKNIATYPKDHRINRHFASRKTRRAQIRKATGYPRRQCRECTGPKKVTRRFTQGPPGKSSRPKNKPRLGQASPAYRVLSRLIVDGSTAYESATPRRGSPPPTRLK